MNRFPITEKYSSTNILYILRFFVVFAIIFLFGCSLLEDKQDKEADWSAKKFYKEAKAALDRENYDKAIKLYEKLEARYPFGLYAAQAQLDIAYAYYKFQEPDSAIAAADRFIKLHPRNPHVDYAYYLKGLVNYNRGIGFLGRFIPTDTSQRDPGPANDAYRDFSELTKRFPQSRYFEEAKQRMVALQNNLAMYEIHVARYYFKKSAYVATLNRANGVIEKYQRTEAVPLALKIMEQAYTELGMNDLARDTARVYAFNYGEGTPTPEEQALKNRSFTEKVWDFIGLDK